MFQERQSLFINITIRSCFFHIRSLSKVRTHITCKVAGSIAVCLILSKLDYCMAFYCQKQMKRLQAVQNAAAKTNKMVVDSFTGFQFKNGFATKVSLPHTGQFRKISLSIVL